MPSAKPRNDISDKLPEIVRQSLVIVGEFLAANQLADLAGTVVVQNGEDKIPYQFAFQQTVKPSTKQGEIVQDAKVQEETNTPESSNSKTTEPSPDSPPAA